MSLNPLAMLAQAMPPQQLIGMVLTAFRTRTPTDDELTALVALLTREYPEDVPMVRSLLARTLAAFVDAEVPT